MSDDKAEELKRNILSPSQWVRILYMAFYAVACWVLTIIISVIIVAQVVISLITGRDNENLRTTGKKLSDYFHDLLDFLVYASEDKPWPFDDNNGDGDSDDDDFDNDIDNDIDDDDNGASNDANDSPPPSYTAASSDDVFADMSFTDDADGDAGDADEKMADDKDNAGSDDRKDSY